VFPRRGKKNPTVFHLASDFRRNRTNDPLDTLFDLPANDRADVGRDEPVVRAAVNRQRKPRLCGHAARGVWPDLATRYAVRSLDRSFYGRRDGCADALGNVGVEKSLRRRGRNADAKSAVEMTQHWGRKFSSSKFSPKSVWPE